MAYEFGTDADDVLEGTVEGDLLLGLLGNDTLIGGEGSDELDGGEGEDIAVFAGNRDDFTISKSGIAPFTSATVWNETQGFDTLHGIEILRFDDGDAVLTAIAG